MDKRKIFIFVIIVLFLATLACGGSNQAAPPQADSGRNDTATSGNNVPADESPAADVSATEPPVIEAPIEEPATEAATTNLVEFANEVFLVQHPEGWFADALAGLGFFASDSALQQIWYSDQGTPNVPEGALLIIMVGSREDLGIYSQATALEAMSTDLSDWNEGCQQTSGPDTAAINQNEAVFITAACTSPDGVGTIIINALMLNGDQAAGLTGIIATAEEDIYLPVLQEMINSFQFAQP